MPSKEHLNGHVLTLQVTTFKFDKHFTEFEIKDSGFTMEHHKQAIFGALGLFFWAYGMELIFATNENWNRQIGILNCQYFIDPQWFPG